MSGVARDYNQKVVDDFIAVHNPYNQRKTIGFDLRAYAKYIRDHNLKASEITPEIMDKFKK